MSYFNKNKLLSTLAVLEMFLEDCEWPLVQILLQKTVVHQELESSHLK